MATLQTFGGGTTDFILDPSNSAKPLANAPYTVIDASTMTAATGLLDASGVSTTQLTSDSHGRYAGSAMLAGSAYYIDAVGSDAVTYRFGPMVTTTSVAQAVDALPQVTSAATAAQTAAASAAAAQAAAQAVGTTSDTTIANALANSASLTRGQSDSLYTQLARGAVNVLDHGAVGNGSADDTAAIAATVSAAATFGADVYIPRHATCKVSKLSGLDYMVEMKPRMRFFGGGTLKVSSSAGDFRSMIAGASPSTDLSDSVVEGLVFDMNNTGNPATTAGSNGTLFTGNPRYAVYAPAAARFTVRGCTFKDIDSVNTVVVGGTSARIQDNTFTGVGASNNVHDHSTVYCTADGSTITGNIFEGVAGGKGATTAIETHGAGQIVGFNRARDYYTGYNITGIAAAGSDGAIVTHNTARDVNIGFDLWSGSGTGLRHASLDHNVVIINHDNWIRGTTDYPRGIMVDPGVTVDIDTLNLDHNDVWFKPSTAASQAGELQAAAYSLWISSTTPVIRNFTFDHNTANGSFSTGLRLAATILRADIDHFNVVDPGSSSEAAMPSAYKSAMTIVGTVTDLRVGAVRLYDTRGTHVVQQGVWTSVTAATRCTQGDITVTCTDGAVVPTFVQTAGKPFKVIPGAPVAPRFTTSLYYTGAGTDGTVALTNGNGTTHKFWVGQDWPFDRIGTAITVAGTTGTVIRFGVWADDGLGSPGALILDAGTVAGDAVASSGIEKTIAQQLPYGLYHLGLVPQGGNVTVKSITGTREYGDASGSLAAVTGSPRVGFTFSAAGALPATFTSLGQTTAAGFVFLRAA